MKKKLVKKINFITSTITIIVLMPLIVTIVLQGMEFDNLLAGSMGERIELAPEGTGQQEGTERQEGADRTAEAEGKVAGIAAKEISMNSGKQAILAQCVIARTNLYDAWKHNTKEPDAMSVEEMQQLWGEDFNEIYRDLKEYAAETENEVITWEGACIYAAYHAVSAGRTRNMAELYGDAKMPYLSSQECGQDAMAEGYLSVLYWDKSEFMEKCSELFPESTPTELSQVQVLERDGADYVKTVQVGAKTFDGEEFRIRFGLNSSCFTITETEDKVRIVTKGIGHGFGLSQHTAAAMAEGGASFAEILDYFYPGTELKKIGEID